MDNHGSRVEEVMGELATIPGVRVVTLYHRNMLEGYEPVLWKSGVVPDVPPYVSSASDLGSYLRSHPASPFAMGARMFKDSLVCQGLKVFGVERLFVAPIRGNLVGKFFLTVGVEGDDGSSGVPNAEFVEGYARRVGEVLERAYLGARVRGGRLSAFSRVDAAASGGVEPVPSSIPSELPLLALRGSGFDELLARSLELLGDCADAVLVEDADGRCLGTSSRVGFVRPTGEWLRELERLPYLDWLGERTQPLFVPRDASSNGVGRLVRPLEDARGRLGIISVATSDFSRLACRRDVLSSLYLAAMYLIRQRSLSRAATLKSSLDSVENERARVSIQLHDATSQDLVALKVRLATAQAAYAHGDHDGAMGIVEDCSRIADGILDDVNALSADLRSSELTYLGLRPAIEAACLNLLGASDIEFSVYGNACGVRFNVFQENMLLAGVIEAIGNCARHSRAHHVEVELHDDGGWFTISVSDDGCGFVMGADGGGGSGVKAMNDCAVAIGGDFWMGSEPGLGTLVRFSVPNRVLEEAIYE